MPTATLHRRARGLWISLAVYVGLIYFSLSTIRHATDWLRARNLLTVSVVAVFLLTLALLIRKMIRDRPSWKELALYGSVGLGFLATLPHAVAPEEQVHLVEYGLVGGLCWAALDASRRLALAKRPANSQKKLPLPLRFVALSAILLASALGWTDELIQGILPNRFYDIRDIAINVVAATLVVIALAGRAWIRRNRTHQPPTS